MANRGVYIILTGDSPEKRPFSDRNSLEGKSALELLVEKYPRTERALELVG